MLLIVTQRDDIHADWLIAELHNRQTSFLRFNTEDYPQRTQIAWRSDGQRTLRFPNRERDLAEISAVWYRRPAPPQLASDLPPSTAAWARSEAREALLGVWRTLNAVWVNHPDCNRVAESKLNQLQLAREVGFEVPATLVTNDRDAVREFMADHPGGVICKPVQDGRVPNDEDERLFFTSLLDPATVSLDQLGPEPYLFQEHIPKSHDIRATVIGDEVLAAAIDSQQDTETRTDWRRGHPGSLGHEVTALPDTISERCLDLCRRLGLLFGAIDLAIRPDGGYSFFEINPNGQWAWVEQRTGLPLRSRLADLLLAPGSA